jgi:hypothetical protein
MTEAIEMESMDLEMLGLFVGMGLMVVLGAVMSWIRSRADRRLSAALNAYAEREIAKAITAPSSEHRRAYAFSET